MIHHVVYFQTHPHVDDGKLQEMVRVTRSLLLKIPEVLSVKSGRNVIAASEWNFYTMVEVESLKKLQIILEDPMHLKWLDAVIRPNTCAEFAQNFELDPSIDLKYS
jgi:Stress responsive A/B Barrel Domain